jgi:thiol-disulfide isomerase/thioredoxin
MIGRRRWVYAAVAAAAGLGGAGLAWWRFGADRADARLPAAFWDLEFQSPSAVRVAMASLRGRPLLVNFWATWCPPCIEELPLLDVFYREHQVKGWQVLGLAVDKPDAVREFMTKHPVSFPLAIAGTDGIGLSKSLGNLGAGLPFSVVVGADGTLRTRKMGKVSSQDLLAWSELK